MLKTRIIKHEVIKGCGSFEVQYSDGKKKWFYFEDIPGRRLRPEQVDSSRALQEAKTFAGRERDKMA